MKHTIIAWMEDKPGPASKEGIGPGRKPNGPPAFFNANVHEWKRMAANDRRIAE